MSKLPSLQHSVLATENILRHTLTYENCQDHKAGITELFEGHYPEKILKPNIFIPRFMEYNFWNSKS